MPQPIARNLDPTACPSHFSGTVNRPPGNVQVNSRPVARLLGTCDCGGGKDRVITGAATVRVNGLPVARRGDFTVHGGAVMNGSPNVVVGGPTVGGGTGASAAGDSMCKQLAAGRASGSTRQSFGNCGLESVRVLIARQSAKDGRPVPSENELLVDTMNRGDVPWGVDLDEWYASDPNNTFDGWAADTGASNPDERKQVLTRYGIDSEVEEASLDRIARRLSEGRGVITSHDSALLYEDGSDGGHAVTVTGIEYGADGKPETVIVADTGNGNCHSRVPAERFARSLRKNMNTTKEPIWK